METKQRELKEKKNIQLKEKKKKTKKKKKKQSDKSVLCLSVSVERFKMIVHYQNIEECILMDLLIYASVEKKKNKNEENK